MNIHRTTFFPEIGKGPRLRALLEERVSRLQADGVRASLASGTYVMDGPTLSLGLRFDDLPAFEAFVASPGGQAATTLAAESVPLTRQPAQSEVLKVLLSASASDGVAGYVQETSLTPFAGKSAEVRDLSIGRARELQASGVRAGVSVHMTDDNRLVTDLMFEDLAGLEKLRAENHTDLETQRFLDRLSALATRTKQVELFQILVPFQSV